MKYIDDDSDYREQELKESEDRAYAYIRSTGYLYNALEDVYGKVTVCSTEEIHKYIREVLTKIDNDLEAL